MRLHYKAHEIETIQYVDVMSLYPYTCKNFKFNVRHPTIHVGIAFTDIKACLRLDGMIKCSVVPPETFYHHVLPLR